ncbi:hypothetical protein [Flavilitoribacter nigricans]|uniref:hypothetical protein n=1 Tax=Flavilitoribacter nigricans TaxID=70997 RepID=UPI00117B6177|nr:hypothetical protein [Flavilitoribacter nigricans]
MRSNIKISLIGPCAVLVFLFACRSHPVPDPVERNAALPIADYSFKYDWFLDPPNEFRSHPFYSLNDSLEAGELSRQIRDFKQAGFGGFYLHSRQGLLTDYLSEEWWELMNVAVESARDVQLRAMFYDEDKWPSGYAGGLIPEQSEDFRAKGLAKLDLETALPPGSTVLKKDSAFQYIQYTAQYGYDIFNGTCYVDLYNPKAVRQFMESTHLPYFGKFGPKIKAGELFIFTDEPHIHARYFPAGTKHYGTLSYSPYLEEKFWELYGDALRDQVDLLFEEKGNWREVRWQYHRAKSLLFEESYTRQIAEFCAEHGAQLTGHFLGEDGLQKVRDRIGNSSLHYRSMQQPGIDHLGLTIDKRIITAKYLSSVANQYGKRMRLSELFGISGQNINFQERKWLGGWHAVLGINHFCPHLTSYSITGARKRDYPPTFSYHQPYWPYNKIIEDYLGRISYAATVGQYDPRVLVISPLESEYLKSRNEGEFTGSTLQVLESLQDHHIDFDMGDEEILSDIGEVDANRITVGEMQYRYVILPSMLSLRRTTLQLLLKFSRAGGAIFSTGKLPRYFDGREDPQALSRLRYAVTSLYGETFEKELTQKIPAALRIDGDQAEDIWLQTRKAGPDQFYLLYNRSNVSAVSMQIQLPAGTTDPVLWDPAEGSTSRLLANPDGNISLQLAPGGFYWITTGQLSKNVPNLRQSDSPRSTTARLQLQTPWLGKRLDPNALLLDFAAYSMDGGQTYSEPEPVIGIWNRLKEEQYRGDLRLKFSAAIQSLPEQCALAIERPHNFRQIQVNRQTVTFGKNGDYFIDRGIASRDITSLLRTGRNEIDLQISFSPPDPLSPEPAQRYETELESIYLTGDFGVFSEQVDTISDTQRNRSKDLADRPAYAFEDYFLDREKSRFSENLTLQGYPFYAGSFTLANSFEIDEKEPGKRYTLDLSEVAAMVIEVSINEQFVDTLSWSPYRTDITDYIKPGRNAIQLKIVNSLRNLLGPHHHRGGELIKVGPNSFTGAGGFPDGRGEADWYDLRKTRKDLAIWTDTYYHIPFGFLANVAITIN